MLTRLMSKRKMAAATTSLGEIIIHDAAHNTFKAKTPSGGDLGNLDYRWTTKDSKTAVDFYHTYTSPEAQGRGIAAHLVKTAFEWAKKNNYVIIGTCSYVEAYINKNPEWRALL